MKRLLTATAAATCVAALMAPANADDVIEIKFWELVNPGMEEFVAQAKDKFEEMNPGIRIVHEEFPNEAYKTAIQVALNGSEPPDAFFNWIGEDSARFIRDGLAMDISAYGTGEDGFQTMLSEGWLSPLRSGDGLYGVPMEAVSKFFYYNVEWFAQHELAVPETFSGLLQLCRDIRAIDADIIPMPLGNSERWKLNHFITMLNERVLGHEVTAADYDLSAPEDELFANPGYVTAWEKVLELQDAGCFQDAPNATSPELTRAMFSSGASPMIYCGSWCAGTFEGDGFTGYALFRMPAIEDGTGTADTNFVLTEGYQVSAQSAHAEETVKWLSFLVSPEMAKIYAEDMSRIPSNPALLGDSDQLTEQFQWMANDVASVSAPINVLDVLLENSVSEAYLDAGVEVLNGTLTPQEAMDQIRQTALQAKANL